MPHEERYSFEDLNEPVFNRPWDPAGNHGRSYSAPQVLRARPGSDEVSPISAEFEPGLHEIPNPLGSHRHQRQKSQKRGVDNVSPVHAFEEVRRALDEHVSEDVPARPSPSFLKVRRAVDHVPERPRKTAPPISAVRRKPVPENPRSRSIPYGGDEFNPPEQPPPPGPWGWAPSVEISPAHSPRSPWAEKFGWSLWATIFTNLFFLVIPLLFFALAIVLGVNDNNPTNDREHWEAYQNLMKVVCLHQS